MGKRPWILLPLALFLLTAGSRGGERQYLDVLVLKDGMSFKGVVIEQIPGASFRLETLNGSVLTFTWDEVEKIRKEPQSVEELEIRYIDVVLLKSGVIFKGNIIEQVPGEAISLEAANGKVLLFRNPEIWKIVKEREFLADEAAAEQEKQRMEKLRATLTISVSLGGGGTSGAGDKDPAGTQDSLQDEVARLQEEMEALETEQEDAAAEAVDAADEEKAQLAAEIEALREELERLALEAEARENPPDPATRELAAVEEILCVLLDEIMEISKGMWTSETGVVSGAYREELPALSGGLQELVGRTVALAERPATGAGEELALLKADLAETLGEIRDLARQRRQEDIAATQFMLGNIFESEKWRRPANLDRVETLSASLTAAERREVYRDVKKEDQTKAFLLNLIPLASAGSWSQGDKAGALTSLGASLGGLLVAVGQQAISSPYDEGLSAGLQEPAGMTAAGLVVGAYIYQLVRPFLYAGAENARRREALDLTVLGGES